MLLYHLLSMYAKYQPQNDYKKFHIEYEKFVTEGI
jgi:hypothetical protein